MAWVRVDDSFADHPKIIAAGPLASWLYVCGLTYCARLLTDGFIPAGQVRKLADLDGAMQLAETLVECGLWERCDGGFRVHDFLQYNPTAEKVRADRKAAQERMQKHRSGEVRANSNGSSGEVRVPHPDPSRTPPVPIPTGADAPGNGARAPAPLKAPKRTKVDPKFDPGLEEWGKIMRELAYTEDKMNYETDKFIDHFLGTGDLKADWTAAWRNWLRRSHEGFRRATR